VNRRRLEVRTRMRLTDAHSVRPRTMKPAAKTTLRPRGSLSQVGTLNVQICAVATGRPFGADLAEAARDRIQET
jgi:hypothetical protein